MLLKALSEAIGVSGVEDEVRGIILQAIKDHVTNIRIDPMGNILAVKPGQNVPDGAPRVMVAAHMDEVGFMVMGIDSDGTLVVHAVGGFDNRILPASRLLVGPDKIPGVIDWKPIHMNRDQKVVPLDKLRVDIGATSKEQASGCVKIGDRVTFDTQYTERGPYAIGKAFDDRVGCAVLIELIQGEPFPFDLHVAFTTQEEVGTRGAGVAAQTIEPDVAFVLEGTTCADMPPADSDPDTPSTSPVTKLGDGPALTIADRSVIVDRRLLDYLRQTADAADIPYQYKRAMKGGTDAGSISISGSGVPSAVISVPCRYIHGPAAMCHLGDVEQTVALLRAALAGFSADVLAW